MTKKTTLSEMKIVHKQKTKDRLQVRRGGDNLTKRPVYSIVRL